MSGAEQSQSAARTSFSFPRSARLLKHPDFDRVYRQGKRVFSGNLTLFFRQRDPQGAFAGPRLGFTVGRALGNAVIRNRIKRRLREASRLQMHGLLGSAVDIVINPKKTLLQTEFVRLRRELERAFTQVEQHSRSLSPQPVTPGSTSDRLNGGGAETQGRAGPAIS